MRGLCRPNPSGVSISRIRAGAIVRLCHRYDVPILEDGAYKELYHDHRRVSLREIECELLREAHESYDDKGRAGISLRELSKMPLLTLGTSTLFREHLNEALSTNGLVSEHNYEFTHVTTLVAMAEAGLGIAILPRVAIPGKTRLKTVKIINPALTRTVGIVKIKGHTLSPAAARLVDLCNQQLASK